MDVKRKLTYIFWFCLPLLLLLNACDDMEDKPFTSSDITGDPTETDTAELYVNPEKPDVPLNKNDAFQKVQKRHVQEKR